MDNFRFEIDDVYKNKLRMEYFAQMLNDPSQSYKFYWLEAILTLLPNNDILAFREIFIEMIWEAWYTVTEYHLKLGPVIQGKNKNLIEAAINILG